jgi:hypothetical protein
MTARQAQTLMNHREFAEHVGRSRRAVRNWIDAGRISPEAIIDGKIWVQKALPELLLALDERKQNTLSDPPPIDGGDPSDSTAAALLNRRRKAEAKSAELKAEKLKLELFKEKGRWYDREEAEKAWGKELAEELSAIEYLLLETAAKEIAADHNLDWRVVSSKLRQIWYRFRQDRSDRAAKAAE